MKSIFFHATPGSLAKTRVSLPLVNGTIFQKADTIKTIKDSFNQTGNRGNAVHAEAPQKLFKFNRSTSACGNLVHVHRSVKDFDAEFNNKFDCVILSMANFIRKNQKHEELVYVIDKIKVPIFVFSAGLQSSISDMTALSDSTVELINILNKKAKIFGVRGEKTRIFLNDNGYYNTSVIGCPSLYVYPENIKKLKSFDTSSGCSKLAIAGHFSEENLTKDTSKSKRAFDLHRFMSLNENRDSLQEITYVFQDEIFSYSGIEDAKIFDDAAQDFSAPLIIEYLKKITKNESFSYIDKFVMFQDPQSWRIWMKGQDFYFGDRFHGGVVSLQVSKPALIVAGDVRVKELTDFFGIPAVTFAELKGRRINDLMAEKYSQRAIELFFESYDERLNNFKDLCRKNGLEFAV